MGCGQAGGRGAVLWEGACVVRRPPRDAEWAGDPGAASTGGPWTRSEAALVAVLGI